MMRDMVAGVNTLTTGLKPPIGEESLIELIFSHYPDEWWRFLIGRGAKIYAEYVEALNRADSMRLNGIIREENYRNVTYADRPRMQRLRNDFRRQNDFQNGNRWIRTPIRDTGDNNDQSDAKWVELNGGENAFNACPGAWTTGGKLPATILVKSTLEECRKPKRSYYNNPILTNKLYSIKSLFAHLEIRNDLLNDCFKNLEVKYNNKSFTEEGGHERQYLTVKHMRINKQNDIVLKDDKCDQAINKVCLGRESAIATPDERGNCERKSNNITDSQRAEMVDLLKRYSHVVSSAPGRVKNFECKLKIKATDSSTASVEKIADIDVYIRQGAMIEFSSTEEEKPIRIHKRLRNVCREPRVRRRVCLCTKVEEDIPLADGKQSGSRATMVILYATFMESMRSIMTTTE
ncbi:hypothetical protein FQA39_LY07995 [Lamprigera yunnana]|nr:hypothetical protein FQA39_LY07995 [Lamprigera yunnana]